MTKDDDFKLLKIQTFTLKVSIHCDGCKFKVKKLLQKIEGVYSVSIDAENQKVTVTGSVDSSAVIKRLSRSGKHAQLLTPQKSNQTQKPNNQKQQQQQQQQKGSNNAINNGNKNNSNNKNKEQQQGKQGLMQGLKTFKSQHNNNNKKQQLPSFSSDEEDSYDEDEDDDEEDKEDMRLITQKMNQMNLLRQQANNAAAAAAAAANAKKNVNNAGVGKKGGTNANQIKIPTGGAPASMVGANPAPHMNAGMMMGRGGVNGMLPSSNGHHQPVPMMMGPGHNPSAMMMMNMRTGGGGGGAHMNNNNNNMMNMQQQQQPQMMYQRAPQVNPYTGYQYQYYPNPNPNPNPNPYFSNQYPPPESSNSDYGVHLFSDENANSCSIM